MKVRYGALALGAVMLAAGFAQAADDRLKQARYHVEEALTQGRLKDTGLLAYHADLALEKIEQLQKFKPDPHLAAALEQIKGAVQEGRDNHLAAAVEHAKAADAELGKIAD